MNLFSEVFSFFSKKSLIKNSKKILIFFSFFLLAFIVFKIKKSFNLRRDQRALSDVFDIFERYEYLVKEGSFIPLNELLVDVEDAYIKNKDSKLSEYILACKSSILALQGKFEESKNILKNSKILFNKDDFIKSLYSFSFALFLKNNSKNEEDLDFSRKILEESLKTKNEILKEAFIFYIGLDEFYTKNLMAADKIWEVFQKDPKYKNSPYKALIEKVRNWEY